MSEDTSISSKIDIKISLDDVDNQKQRLIDEFSMPEESATEIEKHIREIVDKHVEQQGKNWSEEVKEEFTDIMLYTEIELGESVSSNTRKFITRRVGGLYGLELRLKTWVRHKRDLIKKLIHLG